MRPRFLTVLWLGLLLVCCDKPGSSNGSHEESVSALPVTRSRHAVRVQAPDKRAELRSLYESAAGIESPAMREKALADIAWSALEIDPELAREAFLHLPADSPEKIRLIRHYAMRLAERNSEEAPEWANSLETELETSSAIGQIALTIAETDPLRAANLLSDSGIAGRDFDVAVVQVVQRWAAIAPPDAASWVSSFPPGAAREAGIKMISERWLPRDAAAAFRWFDSLKNTEIRKETALAMEGVILQQPEDIRDAWLQHANATIQSELDQQRGEAIKEVGDNIPPPAK